MRRLLVAWLLCLAALTCSPGVLLSAPQAPEVAVIRIEGMIDLGLASAVRRTLAEAADAGAQAVVLEINTHGGRVDAAVLMRDALLESKRVRTVAFVDPRAISAGALIALACGSIVMSSGSTIGAATPVTFGQSDEPAPEKTVSYLRKEFGATAEVRNRPELLAEAMVDPDVEVPGVIEKGKLLTLTGREAVEHGIADATADNFAEAMEAVGLAGAVRREVSETWAEEVVRFLTHPWVSSLLMALAMLGILIEVRTPGFGLPGIIGVSALVLFFWGHWLVELAGWEELLLVVIGLVLLGLEILVIPGFGVAGVLGVLALVAGLGLSLLGGGASWAAVGRALGQVALAFSFALIGALVLFRFMASSPAGRRLILSTEMAKNSGYASPPEVDALWRGKHGTTLSPLRPAGIAEIDGVRVDVVSEGEFVERGEPIQVARVEGNRVVVRRPPRPPRPSNEKET